jgi:hypothetical protein
MFLRWEEKGCLIPQPEPRSEWETDRKDGPEGPEPDSAQTTRIDTNESGSTAL